MIYRRQLLRMWFAVSVILLGHQITSAQKEAPRWGGTVTGANGIQVRTGIGVVPAGTLDLTKIYHSKSIASSRENDKDVTIKRTIKLTDGRSIVYLLVAERVVANSQFRVTLKQYLPTPEEAQKAGIDPAKIETNFLEKYGSPITVNDGEIVALDVLFNPQTGVKFVDYFSVSYFPTGRTGGPVRNADEITFSPQTEQAIREIEQAADVNLNIDNPDGWPVVITHARMKNVPRDVIELIDGQIASGSSEKYGVLPIVILRNASEKQVKRLVISFYRDQKEVAASHFAVSIEPGAYYTYKESVRPALAMGYQLSSRFPTAADGLTVKVRGGNFADDTFWGVPTRVFTPGERKPMIVTGGILNGKAISMVTPAYPAEAKAQGIAGMVTVQITVDVEGNVISAEAVSGPELLREPAVEAARQTKFSPTLLRGTPVQVMGTLAFNFALK